jgi:cytochrome c biogenesis protein CcmG/thiol:disulfide interchange protein DsbE
MGTSCVWHPSAVIRARALLALALALAGCGAADPKSEAPPLATQLQRLEGAPPPLAKLHAQAGELLGGGAGAFEARLRALEGYPVVVNKWASWCPPCRAEFPYFQEQAVRRGRKVAFVGVDSNDNAGDARKFLAELPVPYPSYEDPSLKVAQVFKGQIAFPTTAFYDSKGELAYVKQGGYASEADLVDDLNRYAK